MSERTLAILRTLLVCMVVIAFTLAIVGIYTIATPDYHCEGTTTMECEWR